MSHSMTSSAMPARASAAQPTARRANNTFSLADAFQTFFSNLNAWILTGATVAAVGTRAFIGDVCVSDLLLAGALVAFQPLQEWLIHVYILHYKPRRVFGVMLDPEVCRKHRAHHRDPWTLSDVFIPRRTLLTLLPIHIAIWWLVTPSIGLMMTGLSATFGIGLLYEWTHFLIHTHYKPRSAVYKRIFRYHRLHHFKNEHYWFGVTMHSGDKLLRTMPGPRDVPTSPTARDLGGLAASGVDQ